MYSLSSLTIKQGGGYIWNIGQRLNKNEKRFSISKTNLQKQNILRNRANKAENVSPYTKRCCICENRKMWLCLRKLLEISTEVTKRRVFTKMLNTKSRKYPRKCEYMSESPAVTQEALQKEHRKRWEEIGEQMKEMSRTGRCESLAGREQMLPHNTQNKWITVNRN